MQGLIPLSHFQLLFPVCCTSLIGIYMIHSKLARGIYLISEKRAYISGVGTTGAPGAGAPVEFLAG